MTLQGIGDSRNCRQYRAMLVSLRDLRPQEFVRALLASRPMFIPDPIGSYVSSFRMVFQ